MKSRRFGHRDRSPRPALDVSPRASSRELEQEALVEPRALFAQGDFVPDSPLVGGLESLDPRCAEAERRRGRGQPEGGKGRGVDVEGEAHRLVSPIGKRLRVRGGGGAFMLAYAHFSQKKN